MFPGPRCRASRRWCVRRRHGPDALLRLRGDAQHFHCVCRARRGRAAMAYHALQNLVRRLLPWAPQRSRAASAASSLTTFGGGFRRMVFALIRAVGDAFLQAYRPIVRTPPGPCLRAAPARRRPAGAGRYVEFNLVFDRGTLSACSPADAPSPSCCPCRPGDLRLRLSSPSPARRKRG